MSSLADHVTPSPGANTSLVETGVADRATRATFLSVFIVVGFVGNCVLVATIAQSSRLKSSSINLCIVSLALANVLDSAGNMPLVLGAAITEKWDYGQLACRVNAFGFQTVSVAAVTGLLVLAVDRFVAVLDPGKHRRRLAAGRLAAVIVFFWAYSVAFSAPLLFDGVVPIRPFPVRYLCTIADDAPLLYLCLTSIFCFLLPIGACLCLFGDIVRRAVLLRRKEAQQRQHIGYVQGAQAPNKLWTEIEGAKFAGVMFLLWLVLEAPYLVLSSVMWYRNSRELAGNDAVSELLYFEYPSGVELALTWTKLSYPIFLPAVTFLWKKGVWRRCGNALSCRKSNLVVHASPGARHANGSAAAAVDNGVPVLFATENGLHIQTYNDDESEEADGDSEPRDNSASQVVVTKECDVVGSQFLQRDGDDTSDYDSSSDLDPFAGSNPMSVLPGCGHKRSVSSGKLPASESKVGASASRGQSRCSSEPRLQAAAAAAAATDDVVDGGRDGDDGHAGDGRAGDEDAAVPSPTSATSRAERINCKKSKKRQRSDGSSSIRAVTSSPNDECRLAADAEDGDDACQVERTSHDSGMGSLSKSKKSKKHRKKRNPSNGVCNPEDVRNEVTDPESKSSSPPTCRTAEVQDGRRRGKTDDPSEDAAGQHDEVIASRKVPARLPPLDTDQQRPAERSDPERKNRPTAPPRRTTPTRCPTTDAPPPTRLTSRPVPEPRRSLRVADVDGEPERRLSKRKATNDRRTEGQHSVASQDNGGTSSRTEQREDQSDMFPDDQRLAAVVPLPRKQRRKRKSKVIDPEAEQRKLAEELDQEIQGVLY